MNKIKYLFLLILCVGLVGAITNISAQNNDDKILVAGKKPLRQSDINTLIKFYEWAFEAKFTGAQREKLQEYTENEFRANPSQSRKTIDDIVITLPKILAADEDVQQKTREIFVSEFLNEARKTNDENSQMLVGIYEAARGGNQSNVAETDSDNSNYSNETNDSSFNVGNISALVGEWVWGRSGSMMTNTSGVYAGGNGSRHTYRFYSNGTVEYSGIMNVMTGGCNMQIFRTAKGKATLSGSTLKINWSPASFSRDDSCSPSKNYKKTMPAETETFQIKFKINYGQRQFCMTGKDETCFSPAK